MNSKIKKIIIAIVTIQILLLTSIILKSPSAQASDNGSIEIKVNADQIQPGSHVAIEILLHDQKQGISSFTGYLHYNKDIFEVVSNSNIETNVPEEELDSIVYSTKTDKITIYFNEDIQNIGTICSINLKVKENADLSNISELNFSLGKVETYSYDNDNLSEYGTIEKIVKLTPSEGLMLSSEIYKIGNNDIKNYEDGDKYISRITRETSKTTFISNLETNGTVRIIKKDGTELGDNELVGTGMTLEVTKGEEKIELQIAVMGDLDGNGKVTATDLSTLNQRILEIITLENEYKIAADLDENDNITATDLSALNQMLLE